MAMMECPRCGFTQPKDRYCANCGLDTETYKPKGESVGQKLAKSSMLYIVGGVVIIVGVGWFLSKARTPSEPVTVIGTETNYSTPEEELAATPETQSPPPRPEPAAQPLAARTAVNEPEPVDAAEAATTFQETASPPQSAEEAAVPANPEGLGTSTVTPGATPSAAPESVAPTQLQFQFYEFPRAALATIAGNSRVITEGDQYRILLNPSQSEVANWLKSGRRLPGSRSTPLREGSSLLANFELDSSSGSVAALNVDAVIQQVAPTGVNIDLRGGFQSANPVRFATTQALTPETTLLIFGVVPHMDGTTAVNAPNNSPLVILESPDFSDNLSEFVILVQVR